MLSNRSLPAARRASAFAALVLPLLLLGCGERKPAELPGANAEPAAAVRLLAQRLHDNDLAGFAHAALPPDEYRQLQYVWSDGHAYWPLTELPLNSRMIPLLVTLAEPGSEKRLQHDFDAQIAHQDASLKEAARSLGVFGIQYLRTQGDYSAETRAHYIQVIGALAGWAEQAPLGEPDRAHAAIARLAAGARLTGLLSEKDFRQTGMEESLRRLAPFFADVKTVLSGYGLPLDRSLADLRTGLVTQNGDHASVRVHYPLGEVEVDTLVNLSRHDGRWYLDNLLNDAQALLAHAGQATDSPAAVAAPEPEPEQPAIPAGR